MSHPAPLLTIAQQRDDEVSVRTALLAARPQAVRPSAFWFGFWLGAALVISKAAYLGLPSEWSLHAVGEFGRDVWVIGHADALFALVLGLVAQATLAASSGRPQLERGVRAVLLLAASVSVLYAIVSVRVFTYLRTPLTYPLLYLAGDFRNMRSSVGAFITVPFATALVAGPTVYLLAAWGCHRLIQPRRTARLRIIQAVALVALLVSWNFARQVCSGTWSERDDRRIAENPHWVLVRSFIAEWFGGHTVYLCDQFAPDDLNDFLTVGERPHGAVPSASQPRPRNVIVLVLESVGTQHLGLYGSRYDTTPRLEAEAEHSLIVSDFYCHVGLSVNSLVALSLSIYPGITWREWTLERPDLPGTTLAELLRARGYRTAFITSADNEYAGVGEFLVNRGIEDVWDYRRLSSCPLLFSWGLEDRQLVDGLLEWIDLDRTRPFFLFAWTEQTHHPYEPSPGQPELDFFRGDLPPDAYDLGRYLNVLHELDRQLGRLFDSLRQRGLDDDTLVVLVGDHGEAFGFPHETWGHGGKVYEENVRVPLVLWQPKLFQAGRRLPTVGGHVDLNPTVAELLGIAPPDSWQGRSLFDAAHPPRAYFHAATDDYLLGVREQNWKYIFNATLGRDQLFNLADDPHEQTNLARQRPELCQRLRQRLAAWVDYERRHLASLQKIK